MNIFKTKLNSDDIKLQNIIISLLNNKETVIDINPEDMSYLLSYEKKNYFVLIDNLGVQISNYSKTPCAKDIRLEDGKIAIFKSLAYAETVKRRKEKRDKIFKNNSELLDAIALDIAEEAKL